MTTARTARATDYPILGNQERELRPGGAKVGFARLMLPDRPLPVVSSVGFRRYATTRTPSWRSTRPIWPGGMWPSSPSSTADPW